jgi:hypothetical protein
MNAVEKSLADALHDLDACVKTMATANPKPDLRPLFARIDELARQLPPETDPQLLHFLQRKSYEKARLFLADRHGEIRAGSCGH